MTISNSTLVSVVLPVHNGGRYLAEAVDSILGQTHQNLELLLIDDRSTDGAIESLEIADPRVRVINSKGPGIVNACNTGFTECKGQLIARMDADDISLPERFATQVSYLQEHPDVSIAGCCVEIFSEDGIQGGLQRYQDWLNSVREPIQIHQQIFIESPLPNPGVMLRHEALEQLAGYRSNDWPEDYDMWLRADAAGMSMGKPEPVLLRWREHHNRLTHTDKLYQRQRFMQARIHFLVTHRLAGQHVVIWGAGPTGRQIHDLIVEQGGQVAGFIEVHPRRIGGQKRGRPVWPMEKVEEIKDEMLLIAVGAAGARSQIGEYLQSRHKVEGRDYLFVA